MPHSRARVVGSIAPSRGESWEDALASRIGQAQTIVDFQAVAARSLGVRPHLIRVHAKPQASDMTKALRSAGHWHRDSYSTPSHVISVVGERPTEFLIGEFPDSYLAPGTDLRPLEAVLERWEPAVGDVVLIDLYTIHRRPRLSEARRLFLLGQPLL